MAKKEDAEFEINFYKGLLDKNPDFIEALCALGDLYTKDMQFQKGLEVDERLYRLKPDDPVVLYNLACSYSLLERIDEAFEIIKKAVECGYIDFGHLEEDEDLENLKKDFRFKKFFLSLRDKSDT